MKGKCYVDFLNSKKKFKPDRIYFEGENAKIEAKKWCIENLEKFDLDFIGYVDPEDYEIYDLRDSIWRQALEHGEELKIQDVVKIFKKTISNEKYKGILEVNLSKPYFGVSILIDVYNFCGFTFPYSCMDEALIFKKYFCND